MTADPAAISGIERFSFGSIAGEANLRRLAARTFETYPVEWRVVHEALQNAKDAIARKDEPERIVIDLDVASQTVEVRDTGTGFPQDSQLLGFGGTDKEDETERLGGRQGVGLKAVILGTSTFSLETVHGSHRWSLKIDDADTYLSGGSPEFEMTPGVPTSDSTGTVIRYSFKDASVSEVVTAIIEQQLPYVDDVLAASEVERIQLAIESYFREFTYAGDVNRLLGLSRAPETRIMVHVRATSAPTGRVHSSLTPLLSSGSIDVEFDAIHWNVREAVDRTRPGRLRPSIVSQAMLPAGNIGRYTEAFMYEARLTKRDEFLGLLNNPNLKRAINVAQYERLFDQLHGLYIAIGARSRLEKYLVGPPRQFIAADGIPSAHVLSGPQRGIEASYVSNNIHFVADLDAKLNYGKQTISNPRLVGLVNSFLTDAVRATLRNAAAAIVGSASVTTSAGDLEDQVLTEQDVISRPLLANGTLKFKREPKDENALIAIFFELIGRGDLTGYEFYSMSQRAVYDGRAAIQRPGEPAVPTPKVDAELRNVEFKLDLHALIDDFEDEYKNPNEIQLIVVWDDTLPSSVLDYQVVDIEYTDDADRAMDGVDKALHCKRHQRIIQMLVVSDLLAKRASAVAATTTSPT